MTKSPFNLLLDRVKQLYPALYYYPRTQYYSTRITMKLIYSKIESKDDTSYSEMIMN
jgi:hypothetical protein